MTRVKNNLAQITIPATNETHIAIARYHRSVMNSPIPTPLLHENGYLIVCNGCSVSAKIRKQESLPLGWVRVYVPGWIGFFHACSGRCEEKIIDAKATKTVCKSKIVTV